MTTESNIYGLQTALRQAEQRRNNALRKGLFQIVAEESREVERIYRAILAAKSEAFTQVSTTTQK